MPPPPASPARRASHFDAPLSVPVAAPPSIPATQFSPQTPLSGRALRAARRINVRTGNRQELDHGADRGYRVGLHSPAACLAPAAATAGMSDRTVHSSDTGTLIEHPGESLSASSEEQVPQIKEIPTDAKSARGEPLAAGELVARAREPDVGSHPLASPDEGSKKHCGEVAQPAPVLQKSTHQETEGAHLELATAATRTLPRSAAGGSAGVELGVETDGGVLRLYLAVDADRCDIPEEGVPSTPARPRQLAGRFASCCEEGEEGGGDAECNNNELTPTVEVSLSGKSGLDGQKFYVLAGNTETDNKDAHVAPLCTVSAASLQLYGSQQLLW